MSPAPGSRDEGGYLHAIPTPPTSSPSRPGVPAPPPTAEILGIPLAISDYEQVIDWMQAVIAAGAHGYVTAAAVNLVMSAHEDAQVRAAVLGATLAVPDGQPLVWALRALGHYLYGGRTPAALELLERRLRERFPGLRIVGGYSPPFRALSVDEEQRAIAAIDSSGAQVVWVGTGQPKQEQWMLAMRPRLAAPLLVGVGAAFDFHAGLVPQAPGWMQRAGLEWAYRLSREPRRLWRRYARYNPLFVAGFARQYARHLRDDRG
jgi:N-acetylglucosaminyldiphosphoundecaprenol N-acetyl-beta-D-mannosaminyltransferase